MDTIQTERLLLRWPTEKDASAIAEYMDDEDIAAYIPNVPYPYKLKNAQEWVSHVRGHDPEKKREWVIDYEGTVIGAVNAHHLDFENKRCKIGYLLSAEHQRKGFMSEALTGLLDYLFDEQDMIRVSADIYDKNVASQGLVEKLGFTHEGLMRSYELHRGERHDCHIYSILQDEWK